MTTPLLVRMHGRSLAPLWNTPISSMDRSSFCAGDYRSTRQGLQAVFRAIDYALRCGKRKGPVAMCATGPRDPPIRVSGAGGALAATPAPRAQAGKAGAEQQQRAGLGNRIHRLTLDGSPLLEAVVVVAEQRVEVEVRG